MKTLEELQELVAQTDPYARVVVKLEGTPESVARFLMPSEVKTCAAEADCTP